MTKSNRKISNVLLTSIVALCLCTLFAFFFALSIKAKTIVAIPEEDTTEYTYTGDFQKYKLESNSYYEVTNNVRKNAGAQTVTVSLKDKVNTTWGDGTTEDKEFIFTINRAPYYKKYDMTGVEFDSVEFIEDGKEHTLVITGSLPEGITVSYSKNTYKEVGEYTVCASFLGGDENYTPIPSYFANLTIRRASLSAKLDENDKKETVIVGGANGLNHKNDKVTVAIVDVSKNKALETHIEEGETILGAYEVKITANGIHVQPDKKVTVKLLIPTELKKQDVKVLRITDDGRIVEMDASKDGEYAVFDTEILAKFVLVSEKKTSLAWLWILISIAVIVAVIGGVVVIMVKVGKNKGEIEKTDKEITEKVEANEEKKND